MLGAEPSSIVLVCRGIETERFPPCHLALPRISPKAEDSVAYIDDGRRRRLHPRADFTAESLIIENVCRRFARHSSASAAQHIEILGGGGLHSLY